MREAIRAWTEATETFVLEVIFEQRPGKLAFTVRSVLFALSKIFQVAVKTRRFLYNVRLLRDSTLGVQVIAIGNLTVGGTGKRVARLRGKQQTWRFLQPSPERQRLQCPV
jgi:tetraacyldisaccharide 4'-kinase